MEKKPIMSCQKNLSKLMLIPVAFISLTSSLLIQNAEAFDLRNNEQQLANVNLPPEPINDRSRQYTVKSGDYLSKIAEKVYGDGSDYLADKIYEANKHVIGPDKTHILPGMVLTIPPL